MEFNSVTKTMLWIIFMTDRLVTRQDHPMQRGAWVAGARFWPGPLSNFAVHMRVVNLNANLRWNHTRSQNTNPVMRREPATINPCGNPTLVTTISQAEDCDISCIKPEMQRNLSMLVVSGRELKSSYHMRSTVDKSIPTEWCPTSRFLLPIPQHSKALQLHVRIPAYSSWRAASNGVCSVIVSWSTAKFLVFLVET